MGLTFSTADYSDRLLTERDDSGHWVTTLLFSLNEPEFIAYMGNGNWKARSPYLLLDENIQPIVMHEMVNEQPFYSDSYFLVVQPNNNEPGKRFWKPIEPLDLPGAHYFYQRAIASAQSQPGTFAVYIMSGTIGEFPEPNTYVDEYFLLCYSGGTWTCLLYTSPSPRD